MIGVSAAHIDNDETEPVHAMFGLSYGNYLVLQRSLMEAMPLDWQHRFVAMVAEIEREFDTEALEISGYDVRARDEQTGRFVRDPLSNYRHPDRAFIDSLRRGKVEEVAG